MKLIRNLVVVFTVLALAGLAKAPFDERLESNMKERNLLPKPIELDTWEELGQTSLAIALGGLRSAITPILNIGATVDWENQEWYELEQKYRTITTLQPQTRYYWTTAAWHLYSNAYADYEDRYDIPDGSRAELQKDFFNKGIGFLERSVEENPEDWMLWKELGQALSQYWRPQDLPRSAEAYRKAHDLGGNLQSLRQNFYVLSRLPGREQDAWEAAQLTWSHEHNRQFLTVRTIYWTMQHWAREQDPNETFIPLEQMFGRPDYSLEQTRRVALVDLVDYWFRQLEGYPTYGLEEVINRLCRELEVPEELHPFRYSWDRNFTINPLTGESYRAHPRTKRIRPRKWRTIWMDHIRPQFRKDILQPNP